MLGRGLPPLLDGGHVLLVTPLDLLQQHTLVLSDEAAQHTGPSADLGLHLSTRRGRGMLSSAPVLNL